MQIQLTWEDPATGERRSPILTVPVALGREFARLPDHLNDRRVTRIVLESGQVSRFHALIEQQDSGIVIIDQGSSNGIFVNGVRQGRSFLSNGDTVQIGPYQMSVTVAVSATPQPHGGSTIIFHPETDLPVPAPPPVPSSSTGPAFPPPSFQAQQVSMQELINTGFPVQEFDYAALGAGLGSFFWVDLLRLSGVRTNQIVAIGIEKVPYARYQRLCVNSQIPAHERLRSNSDSCPDNIWGWPSYALREAWHDFWKGNVAASLTYLWQVFSEPTLAETYTPRSGNVFASIDREANRIGWDQIYRYGRIRAIRKTDDGCYVIVYSQASANRREYGFIVARYVHLATGYPGIQVLPDLQLYREQTKDFKTVVNAYEEHEHIYRQLEQQGGTVLLRGRGIVASRIVQRIYEIRQNHPQVTIALLHLLRSPKPQGNRFGKAQRTVKNYYELQPFNWPKACWGGDLRVMLEAVSPEERQRLLTDWGGTTTADRGDWQRIARQGLEQGWYQVVFGEVETVAPNGQGGTITYIKEKEFKGKLELNADFIIDATGLDAKVKTNPLLDDLVNHYHLPINPLGRLAVSNDFELTEMRASGQGRMYAAGAMTLGGPYAAVDSFLGLQYAVLRSIDDLARHRAPRLHRLNGLASFHQWLKWALNQAPN